MCFTGSMCSNVSADVFALSGINKAVAFVCFLCKCMSTTIIFSSSSFHECVSQQVNIS